MTLDVLWSEHALDRAAGFLADDPPGVAAVLDVTDALADDPFPSSSSEFGSRFVRRLPVGRYRILYEVTTTTVTVVHLGRIG